MDLNKYLKNLKNELIESGIVFDGLDLSIGLDADAKTVCPVELASCKIHLGVAINEEEKNE